MGSTSTFHCPVGSLGGEHIVLMWAVCSFEFSVAQTKPLGLRTILPQASQVVLSGEEPTYQRRRHVFNPWAGKIPWRRASQCPSCILAWRFSWTGEPGGLRSIESQRVGHSWSNLVLTHYSSPSFKQRVWCSGYSFKCWKEKSRGQWRNIAHWYCYCLNVGIIQVGETEWSEWNLLCAPVLRITSLTFPVESILVLLSSVLLTLSFFSFFFLKFI